jgi:hypothetical protein
MTKSKTILVIVEGGIVQEVTTAPGQLWDTFDRDDFADDPAQYWDDKDPGTREHIRRDWPELYAEIMKVYRKAKAADRQTARTTLRAEATRAAAIAAMN